MKINVKSIQKITLCFLMVTFTLGIAQKNADAQAIVKKMINAHGGMEKWKNAPSISYNHDMVNPSQPDDHWFSKEIHEQGRRRSYSEWTYDAAIVAFDGKDIWTVDWKRLNPPDMMAGVAYFFLNMVWMTQDAAANLELREKTQVDLIEKDKKFHTVRLTFNGASPYEYFDMYIDPTSYILKGVKYTVTHKGLMEVFKLPEDTKFMGPLLKVYKEYTDVDGLKLTTRYDTYTPDGISFGIHTVKDYNIKKPFDASKLKKPANGLVYEPID
ncbi:hypothetical protein [Leptobacterium sp. I13]|uniref:hypothetical protein n=1 Tax=Leptobacterium meishanense TaxID=3128904 RepID=UPI0030ED382D